MVGNLMGDFVKGNQLDYLDIEIQQGIYLHRAIDKFTDNHPQVIALKTLLSQKRKRFSGIIADVVFDHFLAKHWQQFSEIELAEFANSCYKILNEHKAAMPERMQLMTTRMCQHNWLEQYQQTEAIAGALNGISRRIRFENALLNAHDEVMPVYEEYQQAFLQFFPDLQRFVSVQTAALSSSGINQ